MSEIKELITFLRELQARAERNGFTAVAEQLNTRIMAEIEKASRDNES